MLTGLILTDTRRLASVLGATPTELRDVVLSYVYACAPFVRWEVVDLANDIYISLDKSDWQTCSKILNEYFIGIGLDGKNYCPLFILGGDDVVPMPKISNPHKSSGREYLDCDMAYCFDMTTVRVNLNDFVAQKPRFAVGRLPLDRAWGVEGLSSYLNECVELAVKGIPIRGAAMTTTRSWLRASNEMMKDIPTVSLSEDYVPLNNRMIVSPELDTACKEWYDGYVHELEKIDFLVCNLHGCFLKEEPYFYGEDNGNMDYLAVQPSMLDESAPYIFNTVACYGARYKPVVYFNGFHIDYTLEESMLMKALACGTMLYCGACDSSIGGNTNYPAMFCELLMKLYNIYLHQGIPAGLALIKAKQDYYRTCANDNGLDSQTTAMFTILEFNLFGCPILSMQPKMDIDYKPELSGNPLDETSVARYRPKTREVVFEGAYNADDIHAYVRGLVDNNLNIIRQKVERNVYQRLGLGNDSLKQIVRVSEDDSELGYQFVYERKQTQSQKSLRVFYLVDTNTKGEIINILQSK